MGNRALTLAVTLMAADTWLARASPCKKSKYAVNCISTTLENTVQLKVCKNFDDEEEREMALEFVIYPFTKSVAQTNGSGLGRIMVQFRNTDVIGDLTPCRGA